MPYGSRGGMAFGADELRVLRRALAHVLQSTSPSAPFGAFAPDRTEDIQEYLRLAEAVDEAVHEGGRLRAFLLADLARYREALPGSAAGYLAQLQEVLATGYVPGPDDLAALRAPERPAHRSGGERAPHRAAAPLRAAGRALRTRPAARAARRPVGRRAREAPRRRARAAPRAEAAVAAPEAGPPHPHAGRGLPAPRASPPRPPRPGPPERCVPWKPHVSRRPTPWITSQRCFRPW